MKGRSLDRYSVVGALICGLLELISPLAILWVIWVLSIFSFNTQSVWALAHVSEKALEAVDPPVADSDSAPSVIFEIANIRVVASALHGAPNSIGSRFNSPVLLVGSDASTRCFPEQIAALDVNLATAVASADPFPSLSVGVSYSKHYKQPESLPCLVDYFSSHLDRLQGWSYSGISNFGHVKDVWSCQRAAPARAVFALNMAHIERGAS